jgi:sec-independent protein translocase protein TatA
LVVLQIQTITPNFVFLKNHYMFSNFLFSMPGGSEWILIIVVVLLMFGGKKIPELMRGLGRGIREFNDAKSNVKKEIEEGISEKEVKASQTTSTTSAPQP